MKVDVLEQLARLEDHGLDTAEFKNGFYANDSAIVASLLAYHFEFRLLPILKKTKIPCLKGWPINASSNLKDIFEWRAYRRCDFALLTGKASGVSVLDIDGPQGTIDLARLCAELGPLPPTITVISGRQDGGRHLWFKAPLDADDLRTVSKVLDSNIDLRGWGGQIVLPGSEHRSGTRYQFAPGHAPGEIELPPLPAAWFAALPKHIPAGAPVARTGGRLRSVPLGRRTHSQTSLIGDGVGYGGFDLPLYKNAIRFFFDAGVDAPADPLINLLRELIVAAPKDPERDVQRYMAGPDLPRIVDRARAYVKQVRGNESDCTE